MGGQSVVVVIQLIINNVKIYDFQHPTEMTKKKNPADFCKIIQPSNF